MSVMNACRFRKCELALASFCRVYIEGSNSRTDSQESRIIAWHSWCRGSRVQGIFMRPQNQIAVILMPIRVTLTVALICTLWRARAESGGSAGPSVRLTPREQPRKDGTWCQPEQCKCP